MKIFNITLVLLLFIASLSCKGEKDYIQLNENLEIVIDSLIKTSNPLTFDDTCVLELFVDRGSEDKCDITFHIGTTPFYNDSILSLKYIATHGEEINIYSGVESYLNFTGHCPNYLGSNQGIKEDRNNLIWIIRMDKDSIEEVFSIAYANPFLLMPSSPKKFINPFDVNNE